MGRKKSFSCQDFNKYPPACSVVIIPTTLSLQPQAEPGSGFIKYEGSKETGMLVYVWLKHGGGESGT
jgi:hypothetical protein